MNSAFYLNGFAIFKVKDQNVHMYVNSR